MDLFEREQQIFDDAASLVSQLETAASIDISEYSRLVTEYGRLLKQLRRVTKLSDRTTEDLNSRKLDLLDKVQYDSLTGVYNRRYLDENLNKLIKTLSRSGGELSVMMLDVDYFKHYNDTYGHSMGDVCLKAIAEAISMALPKADDYIARFGGEEFAAILPNTDAKSAHTVANTLLESVRALEIPHEKSDVADVVTVSIGFTSGAARHTHSAVDYITLADRALYMSKREGRNKYTFADFREDSE